MLINHLLPSVLVIVSYGSQPDLDGACQKLCNYYLEDGPSTTCDSHSNNCLLIYWVDSTRGDMIAVSSDEEVPSESIPVNCDEALESTRELPERKRSRMDQRPTPSVLDDNGDSYDGLTPAILRNPAEFIRAIFGASLGGQRQHETTVRPTISISDDAADIEWITRQPFREFGVTVRLSENEEAESASRTEVFPEDLITHFVGSGEDLEEWENGNGLDDEREEEAAETGPMGDDDSNDDDDDAALTMALTAGNGGLVIFNFGGGDQDQSMFETDPLYEDAEWRGLTNGQEVRSAMMSVVESIDIPCMIPELEQFPFTNGDRDMDIAQAVAIGLGESWAEIRPYFHSPSYTPRQNGRRQISRLVNIVMRISAVQRWGHAIAAATAVVLNHPENEGGLEWENQLEFVALHVVAYTDLLRSIGRTRMVDAILTPELRSLLDLYDDETAEVASTTTNVPVTAVTAEYALIPQDEDDEEGTSNLEILHDSEEGTSHPEIHHDSAIPSSEIRHDNEEGEGAIPSSRVVVGQPDDESSGEEGSSWAEVMGSITKPKHPTIGCPVCRVLSGNRRPDSLTLLGHGLRLVLANPINWQGTRRREWTREHIDDFLTLFNTVGADPADVDQFCDESAADIVQFILEKIATSALEEFSSSDRSNLLSLATRCVYQLPTIVRRDLIPNILVTMHPEDHRAPHGVKLEVNQDSKGNALFVETMDALSTLSKKDFLSQSVVVKFTGSRSVGDGPRTELVNRAIREAFNPANGLFLYSDSRDIYVRPAPLGGVIGQERYLRMAGRLLGLAIQSGVTPTVALTRGCLSHLRSPVENLPLDNFEVLQQYYQLEDPDGAAAILNLRRDVGAAAGMDFVNPLTGKDDVLSAENIEAFILAQLQEFVLKQIEPQMVLILRGLYDVLPFPQLAWLQVPELEEVMEGKREIDRVAFRDSATMRIGSNPEIDMSDSSSAVPDEFTWFWEIVEEMNDEQIRDLIQFVSGGRNQPIQGFAGPRGDRKWLQVSRVSYIARDNVPKAQVCFHQINIPRYSTKEIMKERILFAIGNCKSMDHL